MVDGAGRLGLIQISWMAQTLQHPAEMDFPDGSLGSTFTEVANGVHFLTADEPPV